MLGGIGISNAIGLQRCKQFGMLFTYSLLGGWYCTTHSSSFQNISFMRHISSHVGIDPLRGLTDTCSQPSPHDHMIEALVNPVLFLRGSRIKPYPPSMPVCFMLKYLLFSTGFIRFPSPTHNPSAFYSLSALTEYISLIGSFHQ